MFESPVTKRDLIFFSIFSLIILLAVFLFSFFDERTKIVFCNVGQGDAAYIRIRNKTDVLVDAGPDKSVLSCLGKYMPFWDRKIELIFISHNQKDHFGGLDQLMERYKIDEIYFVNDLNTSLQSFKRLKQKIIDKKVNIEESFAGKIIQGKFKILWPPRGFNSTNDNDYSSVVLFNDVLFTGDASPFVLSRLSHPVKTGHAPSLQNINILKIPHHGSKNGLTKSFLDLADPGVAVISVGKNNSYGHPSQKVLDMLKAKKTKIRRTDVEGDIVFKLPN